MPNGTTINPTRLNNWLKDQPDGYLGDGLLNWLAVTRLVHQAKVAGRAPTELEFTKSVYDPDVVDAVIAGGKYPILGLPGHFVASYGATAAGYRINDPADQARIFLPKIGSIMTNNVFSPSSTDLSYMLYVYPPSMSVLVRNVGGEVVSGNESEEYLADDLSGGETKRIKTMHIPKPMSGKYTVEVTNNGGAGKLEMYLYDERGSVKEKRLRIKPLTQTTIDVKYDKTKIGKCQYGDKGKWVKRYWEKWHRWIEDKNWKPWD